MLEPDTRKLREFANKYEIRRVFPTIAQNVEGLQEAYRLNDKAALTVQTWSRGTINGRIFFRAGDWSEESIGKVMKMVYDSMMRTDFKQRY